MTIRVIDAVALDADAYAAILAYFLSHDQHARVVMLASPDEPLYDAFDEPYHVEQRAWDGIMLRLVDVQAAIEPRPALPQASGKSVTIALTDASAAPVVLHDAGAQFASNWFRPLSRARGGGPPLARGPSGVSNGPTFRPEMRLRSGEPANRRGSR